MPMSHTRISGLQVCDIGMPEVDGYQLDRKSTRLNSSHEWISYAVFCLKKKNVLAVDPDLEEADARIRRPLGVHDAVVPVAALQRGQVEVLKARARRLVGEQRLDVDVVD